MAAAFPDRARAFCVHRHHVQATVGRVHLPVVALEDVTTHYPTEACDAFVALGYPELNAARARMCDQFRALGYHLPALIHPLAFVAADGELGENVLVMPNATLEAGVVIGDGTLVWSNALVGHDSSVAQQSFLAGAVTIGGHAAVGSHCLLGLGATIADRTSVGNGSIIGACALVTESVPAGSVCVTAGSKPIAMDAETFARISGFGA